MSTSPGNGEELVELPPPPELPPRRGSDLLTGLGLTPEEVLSAMGPDRLEIVVAHWLRAAVEPRYARVLRIGGTNDKGRDVVALRTPDVTGPWDCYQCKRYAGKLVLSDVVPEVGKLVFWATRGAYINPDKYVFVCPKGITSSAWDILQDPAALRDRLAKRWDDDHVCRGLCPFDEIEDDLAEFQFPQFQVATGGDIVDGLGASPMFAVLLGGGLTKPRPEDDEPPEDIAEREAQYIRCLLEAYAEHEPHAAPANPEEALTHDVFGPNLRQSRRAFYCAETLRRFSLEVLMPPDNYGALRDEIHDGIQPKLSQPAESGWVRLLDVTNHATLVQLSDHPLRPYVRSQDRIGMCHQLANDRRVRWVTR